MEYWEFLDRIYKTTEEYKEERETPPTLMKKIMYNEIKNDKK